MDSKESTPFHRNTLEELAELKTNWFSADCESSYSEDKEKYYSRHIIEHTRKILDNLKTIGIKELENPYIFPTIRNSIQIEYDDSIFKKLKPNRESEIYVEFEIFEDGKVLEFYQNPIKGECYEVHITDSKINSEVLKFFKAIE